MNRPPVVVVVAGTGTGVGKTWVTSRVASALVADGVAVAARKPVQSFSSEDRGSTDAELLAAATGEPVDAVCPPHRWYEVPMAPPIASEALDLPRFSVGDLTKEVADSWKGDAEVGFVELAGGPRSPVAFDGDGIDLTFSLQPEVVVLVADAGLGTINAVRLCVDAFRPIDDDDIVVVLNRFDPADDLHRRNEDWLRNHLGYDVVTDVDELTSRLGPE